MNQPLLNEILPVLGAKLSQNSMNQDPNRKKYIATNPFVGICWPNRIPTLLLFRNPGGDCYRPIPKLWIRSTMQLLELLEALSLESVLPHPKTTQKPKKGSKSGIFCCNKLFTPSNAGNEYCTGSFFAAMFIVFAAGCKAWTCQYFPVFCAVRSCKRCRNSVFEKGRKSCAIYQHVWLCSAENIAGSSVLK